MMTAMSDKRERRKRRSFSGIKEEDFSKFCTMVSDKVKSQIQFLKQLSRVKNPKKKADLLSKISEDQLAALIEICHNVRFGNFPLKSKNFEALKPHKDFITSLSRKRTPKSAHKVVQKGEGFPFSALLLPIILSAIQKHVA